MKSSKITVTIERETPKALLVVEVGGSGRKGWIQRRWLDSASQVTAKTFDRAVSEFESRQQVAEIKRERAAVESDFRNQLHLVAIARQSEKAIAATVLLEVPGGFEHTALVWFPKSLCEPGEQEGTALVPGWLIREREQEEPSTYRPRGSYERHRTCKGETTRLMRGVVIIPITTHEAVAA